MNAEKKHIFWNICSILSRHTLSKHGSLLHACHSGPADSAASLTLQGKKGRPGEDGSPGLKGQKVLALYFHYYSAKLVCS